ncbi:MAG TPA: SCO family protein [Candidatus Saccharimonadales bacterium]|nr:SCO family protein [Candidatus Saccharimonadales bacterium]
MSRKSAKSKRRSEERFIFGMIITFCLLFSIGYGVFLFALTHHQNAPEAPLDDSQPLVIPPDHPRQLVDFSLTDQYGRTVTRADLKGKFLVVSFLFTSCSLTCPIVSGQMAQIQQLTTNQPDVQLVSLTVDPEDDTVPVLAKYGERFGAETNRWLFLTGDDAIVHNLIATSFLSPDTNDAFAYMPGNFANIERIALVGPQGRIRDYFDGLVNGAPEAVVNEIIQLKNENKDQKL